VAVAEPQPEPEPEAAPCDLPATFFATLPQANWPLFMTPVAPHRCLTCRVEPHLHRNGAAAPAVQDVAAPAARVADPFIRQGPAPVLPLTPGETLRAILSDWRSCSVLVEDRERWDKSFSEVQTLMFDPFSRVLLENLEVAGSSAVSRKWTVRDGLIDDTVDRLNMALRSARDLGLAIINILRLEWRHKWRVQSAPMLLLDNELELPVAVFVAEAILKAAPLVVPGARLPPSAVLKDPQYAHWWGVLAATIPIETFVSTLRDFFLEHVSAWAAKPENRGLVISSASFRAAKARRAADQAHLAATAAVIARTSPSHHQSHHQQRPDRPNGRSRKRWRSAGEHTDHEPTRSRSPDARPHNTSSDTATMRGRGGGRGRGRGRSFGRGRSDSHQADGRNWSATPARPAPAPPPQVP
jgi:hypothetical protein